MSAEIINLDALNWNTKSEFYKSLLFSIGAPEWHGASVAAVIDSVIWGNFNDVKSPYTILIANLNQAPSSVEEEIKLLQSCMSEAREEHKIRKGSDVNVSIQIES